MQYHWEVSVDSVFHTPPPPGTGYQMVMNVSIYTNMFVVVEFDALDRQAIFESKEDELSYCSEWRIRSWEAWYTKSPADWMTTHKSTELSRIKLNTWTQQPVPMMSEHYMHAYTHTYTHTYILFWGHFVHLGSPLNTFWHPGNDRRRNSFVWLRQNCAINLI